MSYLVDEQGNTYNDNNPVPFKQMGRKVLVASGIYDQVLNVAAGASISILVTPPVGELWRIKNLYLNVPAAVGATAGTQTLAAGLGTVMEGNARNLLINGKSNFADPVTFSYNTISSGTSSKTPIAEQAQQAAILGLVATNAKPLLIFYSNGTTGGLQSGTMNIGVAREVEYVS